MYTKADQLSKIWHWEVVWGIIIMHLGEIHRGVPLELSINCVNPNL